MTVAPHVLHTDDKHSTAVYYKVQKRGIGRKCLLRQGVLDLFLFGLIGYFALVNRPGVAGAVLQTAL